MNKLLIVLVLIFSGCNTFDLDEKWLPLEQMVERLHIGGQEGITTTVGTKIYSEDIDDYLEKNPPGSVGFDSLLYHEQVHSKRQLKTGVTKWIYEYLHNTEFMWKEEQLGYYVAIKNIRSRGYSILVENVAKAMSGYQNLVGSMVSYDDALQWVNNVLSDKWIPAKEDMWSLPDFVQ